MFMREYRFRLSIPASEYVAYYQGVARQVVVTLASGQNIQFPADALRPFVTHEGVYGYFILTIDENNKLLDLSRVD